MKVPCLPGSFQLIFIIACLMTTSTAPTYANQREPLTLKLWPAGTPGEPEGFTIEEEALLEEPNGMKRLLNVSEPSMTVYFPEQPNGACVLVCPGGGYGVLGVEKEGSRLCEKLLSWGVTPVLLRYRVPRRDPDNPAPWPLMDARRAMSILAERADEFGIDTAKTGVLGFSAGGHLAALLTLSGDTPADPVAGAPRPAFAALIYPAYLQETNDEAALISEIALSEDSPPLFILCARNDAISADGSELLYNAAKETGSPVELHIFETGGHGFGIRPSPSLPAHHWPCLLQGWLASHGWADRPQ
jgi:acetyl esterase/lipase